MKRPMHFATEGPATVAHLATEDLRDEPASRATGEQLYQLIYDDVRYLIVDVTAVEYLGGSAALGVLLMLRKLMRAGEGGLVLRNPREPVRELLQLTRLSELFDLRP